MLNALVPLLFAFKFSSLSSCSSFSFKHQEDALSDAPASVRDSKKGFVA